VQVLAGRRHLGLPTKVDYNWLIYIRSIPDHTHPRPVGSIAIKSDGSTRILTFSRFSLFNALRDD